MTQNITVDGAIEMLGDWFDPSTQDDDLVAEVRRQDDGVDALLLGRRTFEDLRGYWPDQVGTDTTGIADYLDQVHKYVVSTTLTDPGWSPTTVLTGEPADAVRDLKASDGGDIVLTGSIRLTHAVLAAGLVDELRLFVYPVVQGAGRRLYPDGVEQRLRLLETRAFSGGVALLRYA
ncbi:MULTISPECIES: dihydrofolate reductase family protein [unclassified Nocardioides]|uniref:dihydrofolate reductase family protein n=1 Tax=unclassified Nocardioides TaxID=2615069 RepID=UPI00360710AB